MNAEKVQAYFIEYFNSCYFVKNRMYSDILFLYKTLNVMYANQNDKRATKENMHYVVDAMCEMENRKTIYSGKWQKDAERALALHLMIERFG
ncbi:MAG: hypothetical protein NC302_10205 [Bacteroidales bacterium]|nr:hypothetical protein [Bacteroidales bacterium]MCM1416448.1 hypothetical protein [bacterium]MCM1424423.1 hypothetical protein [bacterium]